MPNFKHDHTQKKHTHTAEAMTSLLFCPPPASQQTGNSESAQRSPPRLSFALSLFADSEGDSARLQQKVWGDEGNIEKRGQKLQILFTCVQPTKSQTDLLIFPCIYPSPPFPCKSSSSSSPLSSSSNGPPKSMWGSTKPGESGAGAKP